MPHSECRRTGRFKNEFSTFWMQPDEVFDLLFPVFFFSGTLLDDDDPVYPHLKKTT